MTGAEAGKVEKVQLKKRELKSGMQAESSKKADNETVRNLTT